VLLPSVPKFIVDTDVNNVALGVILLQVQEVKEFMSTLLQEELAMENCGVTRWKFVSIGNTLVYAFS
jgi:hypothetical protein